MSSAVAGNVRVTLRRGRPSAAETERKMADVLRVAREHFVRTGYRAATMDAIAAAAGVTKRTLYLWHKDKAALFRACVIEGAERFPLPDIDPHSEVEAALRDYAVALVSELAPENSVGIGALFLREGRDFPDLAALIQQTQNDYIVEPLASYLRKHGLEDGSSTMRTQLFVAMILMQIHNMLLVGAARPSAQEIVDHATLAVGLFLTGARQSAR